MSGLWIGVGGLGSGHRGARNCDICVPAKELPEQTG